MKGLILASVAAMCGFAVAVELPPGVPRSVSEFREKHPYSRALDSSRKIVEIRASTNDRDDISADFLQGLKDANNGGALHLAQGKMYVIGKPLDLTFLNNVEVQLDGEIRFTNDTPYWQANAFHHPFQNSIMFWKWGGNNITIHGTGTINGNGQRWWNEAAGGQILDPNNAYLRPILFYAQNVTGLSVEGIHLKDSPCWNNFIVTSKDVSFTDVVCTAHSTNASAKPANTDFFDSLNVERLSVRRVWVDIGDDCFSPKTNATGVHVDTMYCNGTHGQSIGSIGQYAGEVSIERDWLIENVWMLNGQHGARIKTWAGAGVGSGMVDNITFRNFWVANSEYAAFIDSCYFNIEATDCAAHPSRVNITNVLFENFSGYTSGKYGRAVARFTCSPAAVCRGISFRNFTVTSPCGGPAVVICDGIASGVAGASCVGSSSSQASAALKQTCKTAMATLPSATPW